jgi:GntR family transcriptional regulator
MLKNALKINFYSKIPLADQIESEIREMIRTGALLPEERLPAVREMAAQLKINFNTVARAYRKLDNEGLISTQQGRGTYVLGPAERTEQTLAKNQPDLLDNLLDQIASEAANRQLSIRQVHTLLVEKMETSLSRSFQSRKTRRSAANKKRNFPQSLLGKIVRRKTFGHKRRKSKSLKRY